MRAFVVALLALAPLAGQSRFERFSRELVGARFELSSKISAAIIERGQVVWRKDHGIKGAPLLQSATAVRVMHLVEQGKMSLDDPVAMPAGATVRQVLSHTADGTPGEEFLYNSHFVESLAAAVGPIHAPSTLGELIKLAAVIDVTPPAAGLLSQTFSGERIVWDFAKTEKSSTLFLSVPSRKLTLIVLANSKAMAEAGHLEDGNVVRSHIALEFLEDFVFMREFPREDMEDVALADPPFRDMSPGDILRGALKRFPELETSDDLTLLGLLSQLHFPETESVATVVVEKHPHLPPAWFYYGKFLRDSRRFREATICFEQITDHKPPWHHWSVDAAQKELSTLR